MAGDIGSIELDREGEREGGAERGQQRPSTGSLAPVCTALCTVLTQQPGICPTAQLRGLLCVLWRRHWPGLPELRSPRNQGLMALGQFCWHLQEVG